MGELTKGIGLFVKFEIEDNKMKYKDEDIKYFINRELIHTPKQTIRSSLFGVLFFGLPFGIFAMVSIISKIVTILIIIALCLWSVFLLRNPIVNQNQFNLYGGVIIQFFSILCLIFGFKELSRTVQLSKIEISLIIILYLLCIIVNLLIITVLIKKGHYRTQKNPQSYPGIIFSIAVLGILFGRRIFGQFSQDALSHFMGIFLIVCGFYFSMGTTNFLRYYLGKKSN